MPPDVVEALEQDLCEPVMDSGSGLVPALLDDVEQDLGRSLHGDFRHFASEFRFSSQ